MSEIYLFAVGILCPLNVEFILNAILYRFDNS